MATISLIEIKIFSFSLILKKKWKMVKNSPKIGVFCWFGGSAALAEASAEAVRPKMTEASAEASVSVVHYM